MSTLEAVILSAALDTNGQNARFAKAAGRWGDDPAVLKALAIGNSDPAGVVGRFAAAADKLGGIRIRAAHRSEAYFEFPRDLVWDRASEAEIAQLVDEADVVHLNNSYRAAQRFRVTKPMLLHHHGSMFRLNPDKMLAIARGYRMTQAVSTIDLTKPAPELLHWLPSAYDVDELAAFGEANKREPDGRVRVVHCPTSRELKHTKVFLDAVATLLAEGLPIDVVLVEGKPWRESLEAKARADIVFDQLAFGYGCNSVEAWAMGKPVVSGADAWTLGAMRKQWGGLPFYAATEATLADKIRRLVQSATLRAEWGGRGVAHVRRFHDERPALARLAELYATTIRGTVKHRIPGKGARPVTFANPQGRRLWLDDAPIAFVGGRLTTDDPYVVARLRKFAEKRPLWGIVEESPG